MFLVIGNPSNRRVTAFVAAAQQAGARTHVVAWRDVIARAECLLELADEPCQVRIEAWGEDTSVERALLWRGAAVASGWPSRVEIAPHQIDLATSEHGRIVAPRQAHDGVLRVLAELEEIQTQTPRWRWLQPIAAIRIAFDKAATHRLATQLALPVPQALTPTIDPDALLAELERERWTRAYVKVSCSSSASCLAVLERSRTGVSLVTSVELHGEHFYNSLRVRRYARPEQVERVLRFLLGEGAHVERAIEKEPHAGRHADVRIVAVRGQPAFALLRTSRTPITNLHLGGARGDIDRYRQRLPRQAWSLALRIADQLCEALGAWHLGVDIAFERRTGQPYLLEANAFGDLLPGVERDGESIYACEIRAVLERA